MNKLLTLSVICIFFQLSALTAQTSPNSNSDGKYYTVHGKKIWTVTYGKGDPLFIIAGGPGSAHYYLRPFDSLANSSTLVYFDGFGRGKSDTAANVSEYSLSRDIDDLEELRIAMGYESINVLGHSYGCVVAQGFALKYPSSLKHLILVSPFHSHVMWQENDDNCNREIRTQYPEIWDSLMIIRKQGLVSSDPLHLALYGRIPYTFLYACSPENYKNIYFDPYPNANNMKLYYQLTGNDGDFKVENDIGTFDYRDKLKNLKMPVLILAGRYDRVAVPSMMVKYKEYCPQAKFVMFERSGHNPYIEEPTETFNLIHDFIVD